MQTIEVVQAGFRSAPFAGDGKGEGEETFKAILLP